MFRAMTQAWFLPQNVRKREERIRAMARASVARMMATGGACDFVKDVALYYPLHVIMDILGVPEADEPLILRLTQQVFGSNDEEIMEDADASASVSLGPDATFRALNDYFAVIVEDRRRRKASRGAVPQLPSGLSPGDPGGLRAHGDFARVERQPARPARHDRDGRQDEDAGFQRQHREHGELHLLGTDLLAQVFIGFLSPAIVDFWTFIRSFSSTNGPFLVDLDITFSS